MDHFGLPKEAAAFLRAGSQFDYNPAECEAGIVGLKKLNQLKLGEIWIGTDLEGDPNLHEDGFYSVPAVSLTGKCASYDPEFILLWLPNEKLFGTWDCDHWSLLVFPKASWSDIVASPAPHLNSQWDPDCTVGNAIAPWTRYEFKRGRPF